MTDILTSIHGNRIGLGPNNELIIAGQTYSLAELTVIDGITSGTVTASKAVVVDANKDIGDFRNLDAVNFDAGASGTAGSVDVFPATAAKGKIQIVAANSAGDTTTTITNASQAAARIYTVPDAGTDASFVMTAGNQSLGGTKTFSAAPVVAIDDATNNAVTDLLTLTHTTSGSPSPGIGAGISFQVEDAGGAEEQASIDAVVTVVTDGQEDVDMVFSTNVAGTVKQMARIVADETLAGGAKLFQLGSDANDVSLDIHPATTNKGTLRISAADSAGDTVTTITNASQAGARTYTIPDAGGNASFAMSAGTNSFTGRQTTTDGVGSGTARVIGGRCTANVSTTDTVTAAASNNSFMAFAQNYSIPANTLKQGSVVKAKALVVVNDASGADTLTVEMRIDTTTLIATTAVDPGATTDLHLLEFELVSRADPGAAVALVGGGRWITNTGGTMAHGTGLLPSTNKATNGALIVDVRAKWSSNTANTSARLEMLNIEIV